MTTAAPLSGAAVMLEVNYSVQPVALSSAPSSGEPRRPIRAALISITHALQTLPVLKWRKRDEQKLDLQYFLNRLHKSPDSREPFQTAD